MKACTTASYSRKSPVRSWLVACAAAVGVLGAAGGAEVDLMPISGGDGLYSQVTVAGKSVWQNTGTANALSSGSGRAGFQNAEVLKKLARACMESRKSP